MASGSLEGTKVWKAVPVMSVRDVPSYFILSTNAYT